jgi:hypothetical protein
MEEQHWLCGNNKCCKVLAVSTGCLDKLHAGRIVRKALLLILGNVYHKPVRKDQKLSLVEKRTAR